ncbi:Endonuclease III 1-like protein [Daphnia magna]|uniref:Endonuclease III homolog n=1 Tax=Daphnia magna TaxID=35525 RepID=A0A0P5Y1R2_9CRUS|nr:Endonuclease III 1-like protein [Daphnia magna]
MFLFLSRVNHVKIAIFNVITVMESSSAQSTYFIPKQECQPASSNMASSSKRQTRSNLIKQQAVKIKLETDVNELLEEKVKVKKARKKVVVSMEDNVTKEPIMPENWETVLKNIQIMRAKKDAPVDLMGAEKCADAENSQEVLRFQVLVSLMLSSQTKDQITFAAMEKLRKHGLSVENIINTDEEVIAKLIHPVGFWKKKASYIKKTATILAEHYNSDIPETVEELCKLPGVGQKMAVLTVNIGWDKTVGIGVDTHVHRIANRLGWTRQPTKTPESTQKELEDWLPRSLWNEVNVLLVGFGQQHCTPVKPHCSTCLNRDLCPVGKSHVNR